MNGRLNPFRSIWTRPRDTIQQIVSEDPRRGVLLLAAIAGVFETLNQAAGESTGEELAVSTIFILALVAGPIGGLITLFFNGWLLAMVGRWMGGMASSVELRAASAWAAVIPICAGLLWIPYLYFFGEQMFTEEMPILDERPELAAILLVLGLIEMVLGIWAFVAYLKCVGQVQGFSAWKALGNVLLAGLVVIGTIMLVVFGVMALFGLSA